MGKISERKRIKEIISVFVKHGIKKGKMNPVNARQALEELGTTFVKIGQILSTRPDILPSEYIQEFEKLQDRVKPEKYEDIKAIVERELGDSIENIFLNFEKSPIASASMAQVHLACTKNNEQIVLKIQRPHVKETILSDIAILKRITKIGKFVPQRNVIDFKEVVEEIGAVMEKELDFLNEAKNIEEFCSYNKKIPYIICPKVYNEYTTSSVLVMEYIKGIKINNIKELEEKGYDLKDLGKKLINNYIKQVFEDGFFHADPHPGNILICGKKIAYIDFGMMGVLDKSMREKLNDFLYAAATRDVEALTQAVFKIGIKKGKVHIRNLHSDIEEIYNKYVYESLHHIDFPQFLDELFQVSKKNNIAMPTNMTMFLKGIMTIEGVVIKLDPDMNIMDVVIPYIKEHILLKRSYKQDIIEQLDNIYQLSKYGLKIPIKTLELVNSALAGKLKVQIEHVNLEDGLHQLNKMINRIVFALIISSIIVGSSLVINANVGPKIYGIPFFGLIGYLSAAIMGGWLLVLILRNEKMY
ncbi:AarF/ABC1/UbiB kinase family protein [Crassaminicella thermophila]|uniref:AarF/ABC1/UbiB kinase family protein n=1 Tax=Crassaminicella thermophila TaxID=2599308 RepID=A0A5C0SFT3_CRATE|nr:AarF/ABC1/UbiB kinase family protein [Crassaminicella thermophila]QEK13415.1 AarF/ABC1/UbiB kinase family protein [Crassaminicella thermophila]